MSARKKRTVVMISGRGSNMASLLEATREDQYPAEIVGVISNRSGAPGLEVARRAGIDNRVIAQDDFAGGEAHDAAIHDALVDMQAEIVCLAGYMRIFTAGFVALWEGRMINIHPSLLPLFRGLNTHRRALEAGMRVHGCTVHFVTAGMDEGPIITQAAVPVHAEDDEASLTARVLSTEHLLYPYALRLVAEGRARMDGARTVYSGVAPSSGALISPSPSEGVVDIESLARMTP
ncbi:MAG: phosphoribosylglycinamide formyltransferase [Rhizobiaceae bacterium]|nr:phosphoribosylglycinamide formyltransferase [Rhizobiaceae bacterium]MCV0406479.1 phosphoribosylglycinamide formyltransferase [Rhizobiaceae bacterium]